MPKTAERPPVALQRAEELRPDGIADPEDEHQEQDGLGRAGDRHVSKLSDEQAREQRARDRAQAESLDLVSADQIAEPDGQIHREVGVTVKEITEPGQGPPSRPRRSLHHHHDDQSPNMHQSTFSS
jgi:hypothetical protein